VDRESQFNTAGGSEFQVRGAAVLNDRLAFKSPVTARNYDQSGDSPPPPAKDRDSNR